MTDPDFIAMRTQPQRLRDQMGLAAFFLPVVLVDIALNLGLIAYLWLRS